MESADAFVRNTMRGACRCSRREFGVDQTCEFQANANLEALSGTGAQTGMQSLHEVGYRARHINAGSVGDMILVMHHDRWSKVDQQNLTETPADNNRELFIEIKASTCEGDRMFLLRQTQEQGVFTFTAEETKAGVVTNVKRSADGA